MMIKLLLITIVLVALAFIGFAIRMIFDKRSAGLAPSCVASKNLDGPKSCACGGGHCQNE